jgi:hypothetical protein
MAETIVVSCNRDCGGGCPLLAHIEGGRVTAAAFAATRWRGRFTPPTG